jgi:hypothetical protein
MLDFKKMGILLIVVISAVVYMPSLFSSGRIDTYMSNEPHLVYSTLRCDRSGSAIQDMLYAHAYVFSLNQNNTRILNQRIVYGGACNIGYENTYTQAHKKILEKIGLLDILPILNNCEGLQDIFENTVYRTRKKDALLQNSEWLRYIHSFIRKKMAKNESETNKTIATVIHIRRGDVDPCVKGASFYRYCPNSYYLDIIHKYVPKRSHVQIFSEFRSYENFPEKFCDSCTMELDKDVADVWVAIIKADIVVLSKSSFSYAPAILNPKRDALIIYAPFWHQKLPHWVQASDYILNKSKIELEHMRKELRC